MGCLCSSILGYTTNPIVRNSSSVSHRNSLDISFRSYSHTKNFYAEYRVQNDPIGSGLFGEVRLCTHIFTGKVFAVKIISKSNLSQNYRKKQIIQNQVKIFQGLDHPAILKLHEYYEDKCNHYLIMEYVKGGDLYEKIEKSEKFSENKAAKVMKQLLSAIAYLHYNKIVHRDVKLENILTEENGDDIILKLIDFDTSCRIENGEVMNEMYGTVYYMAPEVVAGHYNEKCDVWSAGVILYSLITSCFPFGGASDEEIMKNISQAKLDIKLLKSLQFSNELILFLTGLLNPNPKKRLSASEACSHIWIQKYSEKPKLALPVLKNRSGLYTFLSQAIRLWAIKDIIPSNEFSECHMMFIQMDKNFDGVISKEEMIEYFGNSPNVEVMMKVADWNANGVLEYNEFVSVMIQDRLVSRYLNKILEVLNKYDKKKISVSEIINFLEEHLDWTIGFYQYSEQANEKMITKDEIATLIEIS